MARLVAVALLSQLVALSASAQDHPMEPKSASRLTIHFFADVVGQKAWGSIGAPSTFNLGALDLFVHAQHLDKTKPEATPDVEMTEQIFVGDLTYTKTPWEFLVEGATLRHSYAEVTGDRVVNHWGGYGQLSYQVLERVRPYARAEVQRISPDDPFFSSIPDQARQLGGIRFDVIDALAVKLEGGNVRIYGSNGPYARFQVAFVY